MPRRHVVRASTPETLVEAATALRRGEVVGVPTDTVYGLCALASSPSGCRRVFDLKGRPLAVGLPVLVGDVGAALALAAPGARAPLGLVAAAFWPGPLTVVVAAAPPRRAHLGGDGTSIGIRIPDDEVVTSLCALVGPLAVTSANRHSEPPATTAADVEAAFGEELAVVIDAGRRDRPASTVVSLVASAPELLREGPVTKEAIVAALAPLRAAEEHG